MLVLVSEVCQREWGEAMGFSPQGAKPRNFAKKGAAILREWS